MKSTNGTGQLFADQEGRCACCFAEIERDGFCIDLDSAGEVRGLLCHKCWKLIELLGRDPEFVVLKACALASYLGLPDRSLSRLMEAL